MINNQTQADAQDDVNPWAQTRFLASAVVVSAIVVLGVVLAFTGKADSPQTTPKPTPPPALAAPSATSCDLPAGDQTVPTTAPTDTHWELVGKMIAPTAPKTYGPAVVNDGFRTCFARCPTGALYAAVNFWASVTSKRPSDVYRKLAVKSAARDESIKNDRGEGPPALRGIQVAGFRFAAYDRNRATVRLAFRIENGGLLEFITTMLWRSGDWRYEVPLDQRPPGGQIRDLNDYAVWRGA